MSGGSREWVDEVKRRVQIVEIVAQYTKLKSHGATWRGPCPLHDGKGDNFAVNPARGSYKCFVCDEGGDAFTLIMKKEGLSFIDAAKRLAAMLGVTVPEYRPQRRSPADLARAAHQASLRDGPTVPTAPADWGVFGASMSAMADAGALSLGAGTVGPRLVVPVGESLEAPTGWLQYEAPVTGGPLQVTLDATSQPDTMERLYALPALRTDAYRQTVIVTDDPRAVLTLAARGHRAAVAPVAWALAGASAPLLTEAQVARLASLKIRRVALLVPVGGDDRTARLRAIFATEPLLLARGIEPLWVTAPATVGAPTALAWLDNMPHLDAAALEALLKDSAQTVDLFERRVAQVAALVAKTPAGLTLPDAVAKLRPALHAVRASGDRVLYHAYMTWAARALGVRDRARMASYLDARVAEAAHDVF